MKTNRDLYLAIADLVKANRDNPRTLEVYLACLSQEMVPFAGATSIALDAFYSRLEVAFIAAAPACEPVPAGAVSHQRGAASHDTWHAFIQGQITDLRDMRKAGTLDQAFFGASAPSGRFWYNTSVAGFLECAVAGAFGGWQPGDDTGRMLVPGDVAYFKEDGSIGSAPASAFDHPIQIIDPVTWDDAIEFLTCGQSYE